MSPTPSEKGSFSVTHVGFGAALVVILGALFGGRFGGRDSGKPEERKSDVAEPASVPGPYDDVAEPHRAFILNHLRSTKVRAVEAKGLRFTDEEAGRLEVLIATVPDPVDTAFGFWYDQIVESLSRAVCDTSSAHARFAPAGHWSPWERYRLDAGRKERAHPKGWPPGAPFENFPGVMLFRGTDIPDQVMVVLLVSETPNGVRASALAHALDLAWEVQRVGSRSEKIRVIAPCFTGSQPSLLQGVRQYAERNCNWPKFDIISGSANGLKAVADDDTLTLRATIIPANIMSNAGVHFLQRVRGGAQRAITTMTEAGEIITTMTEAGEIITTMTEADPEFAEVAFLVESNTGFGRSRGAKPGIQTTPQTQEGEQNEGEQKQLPAQQASSQKAVSGPWPMSLPYPMHVSRLQAAYLQKRLETEKRFGLAGSVFTPRPGDKALRPNPDVVPSLDELQTMAVNEQAVADIMATIRQSRTRIVGIVATDPQDKLFLVQRLKRDCPGARIFITGMDLSYALPENRQIMRGVVMSTTYPLYPPNQEWTRPNGHRRQTFQSQCGQGYYNAAVFHLAKDASEQDKFLQEYAPPVFAESPAPRRPPVWIVTMGENGRLVPFTYFIPNADAEVMRIVRSGPHVEQAPGAPPIPGLPPVGQLRSTALIVVVIVGFMLWLFLRRKTRWVFFELPSRADAATTPAQAQAEAPAEAQAEAAAELAQSWWRGPWAWLTDPMPKEEQTVSIYYSILLFSLSVCLTPVVGLVGVLLASFSMGLSNRLCLASILPVITLAWFISLLLQARLFCRYSGSVSPHDRSWYLRLLAHGVLFLSAFVFSVGFLASAILGTSKDHVLFLDRAIRVSSGYSVLPPMLVLCAGFLIYAYYALKRRHLAERFKVECPYPRLEDDSEPARKQASPTRRYCDEIHAGAETLHAELADFGHYCCANNGGKNRYNLLILGGVIFAVTAVLLAFRAHQTWEGLLWNTLFLGGFIAQAALVLVMLLRFVAGWKGLETILNKIALIPMVRSFDRLPRKTTALFGGYFFVRRPRTSHLAIPAHILRQVQHEACAAKIRVPQPPVPALAASNPGPRAKADNGADAPSAELVTSRAASLMPSYQYVPSVIAEGLEESAFDYMGQRPAGEEERDYPAEEINQLTGKARLLVDNLQHYWPMHTVADAFGEESTTPSDTKKPEGKEERPAMPSWVEKAEDFVAIQTIIFISQFFFLLHTMASSMIWVAMLLLVAATIYPFQPEALILYLFLGLFLVAAGAVFWVLVRVNKNEVISRITHSTPNRFDLNWTFVAAIVQFLAPVAILLGAHLSGRLRTLVEPLMDILR